MKTRNRPYFVLISMPQRVIIYGGAHNSSLGIGCELPHAIGGGGDAFSLQLLQTSSANEADIALDAVRRCGRPDGVVGANSDIMLQINQEHNCDANALDDDEVSRRWW